jgi:hypothetical protein
MVADQSVRNHEAGVMPRRPVFVARIAQADDHEIDAG